MKRVAIILACALLGGCATVTMSRDGATMVNIENSGWYLRTPLMPAFFRGEPKIAQFVAGVNSDAGLEECGVAYNSNGVVPAICVNY